MIATTDLIIRTSRDDDMHAITEIYAREVESGKATFEIDPPNTTQMTERRDTLVRSGYSHLVACVGDRVLGYAYTSSYRPRPAYRFTVEDSIYVSHDARGYGIASALLNALIEDCSDKPFRQMIAVIGDSANHASINLHRKLGFREVGVLKNVGWKFNQWIDTVLMQRALQGRPE